MTLAPPLATGATLRGRYRLDSELGRGAMGVVFRARDLELGRDVAVKVLAVARPGAEGQDRLLHEARLAATLNHPHVVSVYDVGEEHGAAFVVMELVPGGSLRALGTLEPARAIAVARQLCDGLEHAHRHGIVHRDLKPENVLVADPDTPSVKLADLGVAHSGHGTRMTSEGALVGTAHYLAPEQALGLEVDGRADLYALGALLYELVSGRLPFPGADPLAVISQHLYAPVVPPRTFRAGIPPALEGVILRLLAKDAAQRFASARETDEALAAIEHEAAPTTGEDAALAAGTLGQLVRGRLVGRERELGQLRELWRLTQRGRGQLALVSGEPGAGKTRLAHELMVYARLSGATVMQGGCYEYEAATPYLPVIEALRAWSGPIAEPALAEALGDSGAEIARIVPGLEARLGELSIQPESSGPEQRLRLFDAVARLLQRLARDGGVVLFVDDLHWADQGSLALLHYLLRNLREERLLVLATYREVELDRRHPLAAALVEWERERLSTRVQVGRLSEAGTAAMLAVLLDQETVTPEFAAAVHRETEGNPFFVEEVLKSLIDQGEIYRQGLRWHRGEVRDLAIPQSVKAAIGRRLDRLTPRCGEVLHTAAALGKGFAFEDLLGATGHGEDEVLDALDEAVAAQLIAARGTDSFVFTHDKIREVLYEEMNAIRRRRLHQRIGEALERRHGDASRAAAALAHHFFESGDLERALAHSRRAAVEASRVFAHEEALGHERRAFECAEGLGRHELLATIEESMGAIHAFTGNVLFGAQFFEQALARATKPGTRARLKWLAGECYGRTGDPRGVTLLEQARAELDPVAQRIELAQTIGVLGRYQHYAGRSEVAAEMLLEAIELIGEDGPAPALGGMLTYLAGAYQHLGRIDESDAISRRCIELGERAGDRQWVALGAEFLAENALSRSRWHDALRWAEVDRSEGARIHQLHRVAWSMFSRCVGEYYLGRMRESLATADACLELTRQLGELRLHRSVGPWRAMALEDLGRSEEALATARQCVAENETTGQAWLRSVAQVGLIRVLWHQQRYQEAHDAAQVLRHFYGDIPHRFGDVMHAVLEAEVLLALGRPDEVEPLVHRKLPVAAQLGSTTMQAQLEAARARADHARGVRVGVIEALDRTVAQLEADESRLDLVRALLDRARVRLERGERAQAVADAERAAALAGELGLPGDAEQAEALAATVRAG